MKVTLPVIAVVFLSLFACEKETAKPQKPPAAPQARIVQKAEQPGEATHAIKPGETQPEAETYVYDPKGRRDPFLSIVTASKKEREDERKRKGLKPSEAFDVAEIKVIAIAWDKNRHFAMIQFPDKKYFTVREGTTLGIYGGKVIKIDKDGMVIREHIKDYKGEIHPKDTTLRLRKEEEE